MELTAQNVHDTFLECLFQEGEDRSIHKLAEGVVFSAGFNPDRLSLKEADITSMLNELPSEFHSNGGGGMSFLNMCIHKNGEQWADLHQTMDELVCLGLAIGRIAFLMPREMWEMLPGGMPYIVVKP
jgi:hypothetical protein